jgi:hypothetical protein
VASGVYRGRVRGYGVLDLTAGARVPGTRADLTLTVVNALNSRHGEMPGGPRLGRLVLARLRTAF